MHFFGGRGDIDIHAKIEAVGALEFVPDQQRNFARRKSVDQNLGGCDDQRIRHRGVGYRDALQSFGRINQQGLAHHHTQRSGTRGNALAGCGSGCGGGLRGGRIVLILSEERSGKKPEARCRSGPWQCRREPRCARTSVVAPRSKTAATSVRAFMNSDLCEDARANPSRADPS